MRLGRGVSQQSLHRQRLLLSGPCGSCLSCAVSGTGNCDPVGLVKDPAGVCVDQGTASCGTNGFCDGNGHCANYAAGLSCAPAGCKTTTLNGASSCDGAGHCTPASTTDCTPYACVSAACNTSCTLSTDCAGGYSCAPNPDGGAGTCIPSM